MTLGQAALLGLVQGLTEFLPISSTAHLRVLPALCGWADPGAPFTAVVQLGTLVALLAYFWRDCLRIVRTEHRLGALILVGTIPVVVLGFWFKDAIETTWRSLYVISGALIGLALVLWVAERCARHRRELSEVGWRDALVVGLAQACALVPGASRSGTTMTGGLLLGMTRETAARFSFLLSLPAVFAAGVYGLVKEWPHVAAANVTAVNLLVATVVAAVVGYATIAFLLNYLKRHSTAVFIVYRLALGAFLLILLETGKLAP